MKTETIEVPHFEGYECIGIARPKENLPCKFIKMDEENNVLLFDASIDNYIPRICYRKIKPKRYVFEETGEFRELQQGEIGASFGQIINWSSHEPSISRYKIVKRVEEE